MTDSTEKSNVASYTPERSWIPVVLVLCLGLAVSLGSYVFLKRWDYQRIHAAFEHSARNRIISLQRCVDRRVRKLELLRAFYDASEMVEEDEFVRFADRLIENDDSIERWEWIPNSCNSPGRTSSPGSNTARRDVQSCLSIQYVAPKKQNSELIGTNPTIQSVREKAVADALESEEAVASWHSSGKLWIVVPVFDKVEYSESTDQCQPGLKGFLAGVFRQEDLVAGAMTKLVPESMHLQVAMNSGQGDQDVVEFCETNSEGRECHRSASTTVDPLYGKVVKGTVLLPGANWEVNCLLTSGFVSNRRSWLPETICGAGILLAAILTVYVQMVVKGTRQLALANRRLELEAEERRERERERDAAARREAKAREELDRVFSQVLQSDKMASIGQLAAGVAHEINNPIGFVSSNLNSLRDYVEDLKRVLGEYESLIHAWAAGKPPTEDHLTRILKLHDEIGLDFLVKDIDALIVESEEGARRVRNIVADLRDFSHVDKPDASEVEINDLIDKTINVAWNELKYKAKIVREYGDLPTVKCYGGQIGQVILNLLINAAHAIEQEGTITVRTGGDAEGIWIEIEDNGCGMPPEVTERIFEPFFTTKDAGKGTGLGLHLAYNIIKTHNGVLSCDSVPGRGTVFRVELPVDGPVQEELKVMEHSA